VVVVVVVVVTFNFIQLFSEARDYCLIESFHAQCRHWSDVILMEHAQFGRMELGRCVTRNFGHIGCSTDVINQLDVACSGRPSCDFSVSDPSLVRTKPCPKDFTSYLEASYRCVPGMNSHYTKFCQKRKLICRGETARRSQNIKLIIGKHNRVRFFEPKCVL